MAKAMLDAENETFSNYQNNNLTTCFFCTFLLLYGDTLYPSHWRLDRRTLCWIDGIGDWRYHQLPGLLC
jgi:hypothetical protein